MCLAKLALRIFYLCPIFFLLQDDSCTVKCGPLLIQLRQLNSQPSDLLLGFHKPSDLLLGFDRPSRPLPSTRRHSSRRPSHRRPAAAPPPAPSHRCLPFHEPLPRWLRAHPSPSLASIAGAGGHPGQSFQLRLMMAAPSLSRFCEGQGAVVAAVEVQEDSSSDNCP